jgi:hypothetical protein
MVIPTEQGSIMSPPQFVFTPPPVFEKKDLVVSAFSSKQKTSNKYSNFKGNGAGWIGWIALSTG